MRQNTPILALLLAGLVLAAGVVGATSLREGEPDSEDVAIRVGSVEVTFEELELRREASLAQASVWQRLVAGEDFGMPRAFLEEVRLYADLVAPLRLQRTDELGWLGSAVADAAMRAAAFEGGELTQGEIDEQIATLMRMYDRIEAGELENLGLAKAQQEAVIAAIGPTRYREEYLPRQAENSIARSRLAAAVQSTGGDVGAAAVTAGMDAAQVADIWLHPTFDVSVQEIREDLLEQARFQRALAELQERAQTEAIQTASD